MKYSIAIVALLALSLAACGEKEAPPAPVAEAPPMVIDVVPAPVAPGAYVQESWHSAKTVGLAAFGTDSPHYLTSLAADWKAHTGQ